eukprot:g5814.t1
MVKFRLLCTLLVFYGSFSTSLSAQEQFSPKFQPCIGSRAFLYACQQSVKETKSSTTTHPEHSTKDFEKATRNEMKPLSEDKASHMWDDFDFEADKEVKEYKETKKATVSPSVSVLPSSPAKSPPSPSLPPSSPSVKPPEKPPSPSPSPPEIPIEESPTPLPTPPEIPIEESPTPLPIPSEIPIEESPTPFPSPPEIPIEESPTPLPTPPEIPIEESPTPLPTPPEIPIEESPSPLLTESVISVGSAEWSVEVPAVTPSSMSCEDDCGTSPVPVPASEESPEVFSEVAVESSPETTVVSSPSTQIVKETGSIQSPILAEAPSPSSIEAISPSSTESLSVMTMSEKPRYDDQGVHGLSEDHSGKPDTDHSPEENPESEDHMNHTVKVVCIVLASVCLAVVVIGNLFGLYYTYIHRSRDIDLALLE